jgi:hypothetical protein
MSVDENAEKIVAEFKKDERNKVFIEESALLDSVKEECGKDITSKDLSKIIEAFGEGDLDDESEELYDGAVYVCGVVAKGCFGEDPDDEDEEVDYSVEWIQNDNGSYSAVVRPD